MIIRLIDIINRQYGGNPKFISIDQMENDKEINQLRKDVTTRPPVTASSLDERRGEVPTRSFFDLHRPEAYFSYVGGKRRGRKQSLSPRGEPLRKDYLSHAERNPIYIKGKVFFPICDQSLGFLEIRPNSLNESDIKKIMDIIDLVVLLKDHSEEQGCRSKAIEGFMKRDKNEYGNIVPLFIC